MVVSVQVTSTSIRIRPLLVFLHVAKDRFISGDQVKPARSETSTLNRSLRIRLVRQSATMQLVSIHLTMSGWSDPIFSRNSPSGVSQTICRNAAKSMLSLLSLHFVNVGLRRWSLRELQSIIHTLRMKRAVWYSQSVRKNTPCASARQHGAAWTLRLHLREHTFPLAKWIDTLYLWSSKNNQSDTHPYRFVKRIRSSEKSHPPFLTAEIRLVPHTDCSLFTPYESWGLHCLATQARDPTTDLSWAISWSRARCVCLRPLRS